jgi:formate dehydrogenase subunit gamma
MTTEIERYSFKERVCHWVTGIAYLYSLGTGLAFYSPYLFWIAIALGGGPTSRYWHPVLGVAFVLCAMWMHHLWRSYMDFTQSDRLWVKQIRAYIENDEANVPPSGRFNAGQKQFYWAMFYGAIGLLLSGVVMWFPELMPPALFWLRPVMILLHEISALVTIAAFMIHVYMGAFMVPGGLRGMLIGRVTEAWAKAHHELWFKSLARK